MLVKGTDINFCECPSVVSRVDTRGRTDRQTERQTGRRTDGQEDRYDEANRRFVNLFGKRLTRKEHCITDVAEEKYTQGTEEIALKRTDM